MWAREAAAGRDEATKDRPVVVVLTTIVDDGLIKVIVVPVTTQPPRKGDSAVEMPQNVKAHLKLDDARCWIVVSEVNQFIWPGPDIRPVARGDKKSPYYGKIPGKLFEKMRVLISQNVEAGRLKIIPRTD